MSQFSSQRFALALRNDVLAQAKAVGIGTLALFALGLLIYLTNVRDHSNPPLFEIIFAIALVPMGLLFTSLSWSDMHHPLGRFHYLMLPYSNLERFLCRYLLTAPLYALYVVLAMNVFIVVANLVSGALFGITTPGLSLESGNVLAALYFFFGLQPLAFAGAIRFRNFALARTMLFAFLLQLAFSLLVALATRIFYFDYFDSLFNAPRPIHLGMFATITPEASQVIFTTLVTLACLWTLYLAWLMLNDHEVQDGI